jgi:hypothetical protein
MADRSSRVPDPGGIRSRHAGVGRPRCVGGG